MRRAKRASVPEQSVRTGRRRAVRKPVRLFRNGTVMCREIGLKNLTTLKFLQTILSELIAEHENRKRRAALQGS